MCDTWRYWQAGYTVYNFSHNYDDNNNKPTRTTIAQQQHREPSTHPQHDSDAVRRRRRVDLALAVVPAVARAGGLHQAGRLAVGALGTRGAALVALLTEVHVYLSIYMVSWGQGWCL